jgi:hypothetical protein
MNKVISKIKKFKDNNKVTYQEDFKEFGFYPLVMDMKNHKNELILNSIADLSIEELAPKVRHDLVNAKELTIGVDYGAMDCMKDDFVFIFHAEKDGDSHCIYYDFMPYSTADGKTLPITANTEELRGLGEKLAKQFSRLDSKYIGDLETYRQPPYTIEFHGEFFNNLQSNNTDEDEEILQDLIEMQSDNMFDTNSTIMEHFEAVCESNRTNIISTIEEWGEKHSINFEYSVSSKETFKFKGKKNV